MPLSLRFSPPNVTALIVIAACYLNMRHRQRPLLSVRALSHKLLTTNTLPRRDCYLSLLMPDYRRYAAAARRAERFDDATLYG